MLKLASGQVALEPAVEADAVVVRSDGELADLVAHESATRTDRLFGIEAAM
jgi:hypothetical protein